MDTTGKKRVTCHARCEDEMVCEGLNASSGLEPPEKNRLRKCQMRMLMRAGSV